MKSPKIRKFKVETHGLATYNKKEQFWDQSTLTHFW